MRQQRLTQGFSHRGETGFIKPVFIVSVCVAIFGAGVYLSLTGPMVDDPQTDPALQTAESKLETFEVDTSGIVGGQAIAISGQLRINNTLVLNPSSQPAQTTAGQVYFDEAAKEIRYYDGTSFQGLASTGDVEAAIQQQPAVQQPSTANAPQNITNITQQTINNTTYESATGTVTEGANNTFTGANAFADITVEDFTASGAAALQGSLTVTGTTLLGPASASSLLLSSALDVSSGGTGRTTFGTNEIVIGQGSGALSTISSGAAGLCLMSTAGAPSFQACPGGGASGVTSLAGLTGDLLVANSSTSGSTITIDTATSSSRGLASFNASNLTVTDGNVDTVQDIDVSAAPTFAGITVNGLINGQTISSAANLTGTLNVAGATTATGGLITNSITSASGLSVGSSAQTLSLQGGASSTFSATSGANTTTLQFQTPTANANYRFAAATAGNYDVCTTSGNCIGVGGSVSTSGGTDGRIAKFDSGSNIVDSLLSESGVTVTTDGNFNVAAGSQYQIGGVQISSSVLSNDANLAKLNASQTFSGQTTFRNAVDSVAAMSLQNAGGQDLATLNTMNGSFELGDSSTLDGKLVVRNAANNFTVTVNAANPTANQTVSLGNESGTICLQNSVSCGFITGATGNANYIQNQNSSQQAGGSFWIAGTGRADTMLQAPVFDSSSVGVLTFGGANATSIAVAQNTTLAANKSLLITGGASGTRPAVPSEGMVYFDSTTKQLITYANGKWQADRSTATKIIAASNSTQAAKDAADYVADGTGDLVEINAALTAATGGKVYLMEGTYTAAATIVVPNDTVLSGAGRGTLIQLADIDATDNLIENASAQPRVTIRDLRIDGQKTLNTAGTQHGILLNGGAGTVGAVVENVEVMNFRTHGVYSLIAYTSITNVTSEGNTDKGFLLQTGTHQKLEGVTARSNGQQGIWIDSGADLTTVSNSKFISSGDRGVRIIATGVKFSNNTVTGNGGTGIEVATNSTNVSGNTVTGNSNGIVVAGSNNTITDNDVSSNTSYGVLVGGSTNTTISSNYIGSNNVGIGVGDIVGVTITSNTISGNTGNAILLDLTDQALIANNYISNNGGAGASSSIRMFSGCCGAPDNNRIIDNVITDTAGTGFAILISNGSRNHLSGNIYSGTGASSISDAGTGTIYVNQLDANGNLINRGTATTSVNTTTATSSLTLQGGLTNTQLPVPALPVIARVGTAGTTTYGYKVTALDGTGETLPSSEGTIATANATLTGANYNTITWTSIPGAVQYKIYRTTSGGTPASTGLIGTVTGSATSVFNDTGIAATTAAPGVNTTGGLSIASNIQGANATLAGGTVSIGTTAQQGSLVLSDGSSNTATLQVGNLAGNYAYTIPVTTGNDTFCMLTLANCSGGAVSAIGSLDGGTPSANGASISGTSLFLQSASGINAGLINTTTQTFAGDKTFTGLLTVQDATVGAGSSITFVGGITGTRPASPTEGMVYFDTTTKQLITYASGKWQADRSTSTKIVGTSAVGGASGAVASAAPDGADFVNTSITSAQTVISSAITALPAGGGTVYLMEGTYIIDGAITVPSNVTLTGAGTATILKIKNATNTSVTIINASGGTNKVISSLKFEGNSSNNSTGTQRAIDYGGAGNSTTAGVVMDKLDVQNFRSESIYGVGGSYSKLTNSYIAANGEGIHSNGIDRIEISHNIFRAQTGNSIASYGLRARITNNNVVGGTGVLTSTESVVANNVVQASAGNGINVGGTDSSITSNIVSGNAGIGISLSNFTQRNTISGNTLTDNGQHGIAFGVFTGSVTISNNSIHNSGTGTASSSGIAIDGYSGTNTITGNRITDTAGTGFAIFLNGPQNPNNYLSGNTFSGTGASSITDTADGTIYSNQVDASGNLINRGNNGLAVGALAASSTLTVQGGYVGQALGAPAQPTVVTQGTAGSTSYTYAVTAFDGFGETTASTVRVIATGNATLTGANFNRITWTRVSGAVSYKVYRTTSGGTPATTGLIGTVGSNATLQLDDTGLAGSGTTPAVNTTGGLSVASNIQGANATLTGGSLMLGASAQQGSLVISDGSSNTATIQVGSLAGNYTYTIPVTTGNDTFCMLLTANCGGGVSAIGALDGGTANATGATISGTTLYLQSASNTNPGLVNTTAQSFAGDKTFSGTLSVQDTTVGAGNSIAFVGGITATRPASPTEGMVYFDTTTKQLITYANGKWQSDRSGNTKIVAAANSSQALKDAADYVTNGDTASVADGDQVEINAALTAGSGGKIYLAEGTYVVDATILVPNNTTLTGAGDGTLIEFADLDTTDNMIENSDTGNGRGVTIQSMRLDGRNDLNTIGSMNGIRFSGMGAGSGSTAREGGAILDIFGTRFRSNAIALNSARHTRVDGNSARANGSYGIDIGSSAHLTVTNNLMQGNGAGGFLINGSSTSNTVSGNFSQGNTGSGFAFSSTSNTTITSNTSTGNTYGFFLSSGGTNNILDGNNISANTSSGINMGSGLDGAVITNNAISSNTSNGIDVASNNVTISGNTLASNQNGIYYSGDNGIITSNVVSASTTYGLYLNGINNTLVNENQIINNGGTTTNNAIYLASTSTGNKITNNVISDSSATSNNYAINISNSSISNTQLSGNALGAGGTIRDLGTGTTYVNQAGDTGHLTVRTAGAYSINTNTSTSSLTVQGGMSNIQLPSPAQPTVATVGTAGTTSYSYVVSALDGTGETLPSTVRTIATGNATLTGVNYNTITWVQVPGAVQYKIYRTASAGTPASTGLISTVTSANTTSFNDTGIAAGAAASGVNTTGGISIAGAIQGTSATLSGGLTVAGASLLNGSLTATGVALFKNTADSATAFQIQDSSSTVLFGADTTTGKITVRTLDVAFNLTVAGHIISGGSTPSIAADAAACTTPTVSVSGTDTAGVISVTTGTGCGTGGSLSTITFATPFGATPRVTLTPAGAGAAALSAYLDDASLTTSSFNIGVTNAPVDATTYKWHYHALQ